MKTVIKNSAQRPCLHRPFDIRCFFPLHRTPPDRNERQRTLKILIAFPQMKTTLETAPLSLTPRFTEVAPQNSNPQAVSTASRAIRLNPSISDQIRVTFCLPKRFWRRRGQPSVVLLAK